MEHKREIRLTASDVKEFVTSAEKCDFDIDVYYNRIALDAKSILGILSLDHRNPITVDFDGENSGLMKVLEKYAI